MNQDPKSTITFILGFLMFLYIYGTVGSLEYGSISIRQFLIRVGAVVVGVTIGIVIVAIKQNREE